MISRVMCYNWATFPDTQTGPATLQTPRSPTHRRLIPVSAPHSTPPVFDSATAARFWAKVDQSEGSNACWPWRAGMQPIGYGIFWVRSGRGVRGGTMWLAHRAAWAIAHDGRDPGQMDVCHRCDNRACCNPDHLFLGTQLDNMRDCKAKGRNHRGERHRAAKLTVPDVKAERVAYAAGESFGSIARRRGMDSQSIRRMIIGENWAHVPGAVPSRGRK